MSISTAQIRGARGILAWSQSDLADRTGISATSIGSIENNQSKPRASTLETIRKAFEDAGIEFIGLEGVRIKTGDVRTLRGQSGYLEFFEEVYKVLESDNGEVLVSNVDERKFAKWHGEHGEEHLRRMSQFTDLKYKILIQEGDTYFPADGYAEYKWLPRDQFSSVPFYVFGKKLGIMLFDSEPLIILLNYPGVAEAYRRQFYAMWENAILPENAQEIKKKQSISA